MRCTCFILVCLAVIYESSATCPFLLSKKNTASNRHSANPHRFVHDEEYFAALKELPINNVKEDIKSLLHTSQEEWPADYNNYGPFFVRLAWHCSGSYRSSDGRGGCAGGRQRFQPEQSWEDNTNLDKARGLLWPIKQKYGLGLSWGDLFILAGTTAIEDMGGPIIGFCAGRQDDVDGAASQGLGPTAVQENLAPCEVNGECTTPLGTTTVGLIYVNPEGPMGEPNPEGSAPEIRDTFGRMGMNDTETVALIGGGHAFGKAHGACPDGAGPSPEEDPLNPWPGNCGTGKGADTYTSGFEGPWTTTPTKWDNSYFHNLLNYEWEDIIGPGGHHQWQPKSTPDGEPVPEIMMFTTDVSLTYDKEYLALVKHYAEDLDDFELQFSSAWYKLTTRDMGPVTRCIGSDVPPAQPFQYPLPPPVSDDQLPNWDDVKKDILSVLQTPRNDILQQDANSTYGPLFVRLAWQCANTHRETDFMGGCNGARIRFSPQKEWPANAALDKALRLLSPVKEKYGDALTWADLIVLSGNVGLETAMPVPVDLPFTGGRSDAIDGEGLPTPDYLEYRLSGGDADDTVDQMRDAMIVMGLTSYEVVALIGGGHSLGKMHSDRSGFVDGSWTTNQLKLDTEYFDNLLNLDWTQVADMDSDHIEYSAQAQNGGQSLYMLKTDMNIRADPVYKAIAQMYLENEAMFLSEFANAWNKVMTADLY